MAQIAHPSGSGQIEVEVVDQASHYGEYRQVQAVEDGVTLSDQSGDAPWMDVDEIEGVDE